MFNTYIKIPMLNEKMLNYYFGLFQIFVQLNHRTFRQNYNLDCYVCTIILCTFPEGGDMVDEMVF